MKFRKTLASVALLNLLVLCLYDSRTHFDKQLVTAKAKHYSAQRNWSIYYGQNEVFKHSSIRYQADFSGMGKLVGPSSVVFSDLASSYYAAAQLPVFIRNVHKHHSPSIPRDWTLFIKKRFGCYLEFEENRIELGRFIENADKFDYWLVNKDGVNKHRKKDCLAFRAHTLEQQLPKFAKRVWVGEFLDLYEMRLD